MTRRCCFPRCTSALVAGEYEELSQAGERAVAWALGLAEDSPLIPVTDVLLTAPQRGLDPDTALGHLLGIPAFTDPVAAGGSSLAQLARDRADRPGVRAGLPAGDHPRQQGHPDGP